jgi:hypothetical protein
VKDRAAYLVAMLPAAARGLFGVWQSADLWLFGRLQARDKPHLAADIVLIDVPYPPQFHKTDNPLSLWRSPHWRIFSTIARCGA